MSRPPSAKSRRAPVAAPDATRTTAPDANAKAAWAQMMKRYPVPTRFGLAVQILMALASNVFVVWLVATARLTPFELVALVAIEALLLTGIAWLQNFSVPAAAREPSTMTWTARLPVLAFALFWLGGVYAMFVGMMLHGWPEALAAVRDPLGFLWGSTMRWPLLLTLLLAGADALRDASWFRRHGGKFSSTPALQSLARWVTLFAGGIPFVLPLALLVFGGSALGRRATRGRKPPSGALQLWVCMGVVGAGAVLVVLLEPLLASVRNSGVSMWALCYCTAKFCAELMIVCLPLIATEADPLPTNIPTRAPH